ncbi:MAG: OsmC family protein [Gemmatimonadaceae bacterium]|nr:OsmC family protein [Gemmatimonadaceae bacterium]
MATHHATIHWQLRTDDSFTTNRYSRRHTWTFDGGTVVPASSSPAVVPVPMSSAEAVDPEEAFVASLSSCHMLWFLSIASKRGFVVSEYTDHSRGTMGRNSAGKMAMVRVNLMPMSRFDGDKRPTRDDIETMHHAAHEQCFIASSVTTEIVCTPNFADER